MRIRLRTEWVAFFAVAVMFLSASNTFVQGEEPAEENTSEEEFKRHKIALSFGYTHIPGSAESGGRGIEAESGSDAFVPGLGLDYFYRMDEKWQIGAVVDVEFGEYLIIDQDLNRKNAVLFLALLAYEIMPSWAAYAGPGYEFEEHENLFVFRIGTDYEFELQDEWFVAPGAFVDYKQEFVSWGLYVAGGKAF